MAPEKNCVLEEYLIAWGNSLNISSGEKTKQVVPQNVCVCIYERVEGIYSRMFTVVLSG